MDVEKGLLMTMLTQVNKILLVTLIFVAGLTLTIPTHAAADVDMLAETSVLLGAQLEASGASEYKLTHYNGAQSGWPTFELRDYLPNIAPGETITISLDGRTDANSNNKGTDVDVVTTDGGFLTEVGVHSAVAQATTNNTYIWQYKNNSGVTVVAPKIRIRFSDINDPNFTAYLSNLTYSIQVGDPGYADLLTEIGLYSAISVEGLGNASYKLSHDGSDTNSQFNMRNYLPTIQPGEVLIVNAEGRTVPNTDDKGTEFAIDGNLKRLYDSELKTSDKDIFQTEEDQLYTRVYYNDTNEAVSPYQLKFWYRNITDPSFSTYVKNVAYTVVPNDADIDWVKPSSSIGTFRRDAAELADLAKTSLPSGAKFNVSSCADIELDHDFTYKLSHHCGSGTSWPRFKTQNFLPDITPGQTLTVTAMGRTVVNSDNKTATFEVLGNLTLLSGGASRYLAQANEDSLYTLVYRNDTAETITAPELSVWFNAITDPEFTAYISDVNYSVEGAENEAPVINITSPANSATFVAGSGIDFIATASDSEDGDLGTSISWSSDLDGALGVGGSINVSLNAGSHIITATVTDSGALEVTDTINLSILVPNTPPTVSISSPSDNASYIEGATISFIANATDAQDGDLSTTVTWTSDLDGVLGTGASISANLTVGSHVVTATVTDSGSLEVIHSINVTVVANTAPTISITSPTEGTQIVAGDSLSFTASASDTEDGDVSSTVVWSSDIDGALGTSASISVSLSIGSHVVTATVTDSHGVEETHSVNILVIAPNVAPITSITTPTDGVEITVGNTLTLIATASDNEEGDLSDAISWLSSLDGALGTGSSINTALTEGTHLVTVTVTDSGGLEATHSITVIVSAVNASSNDRTITYTYNGLGLIETIDGSRVNVSDITTFTYDASANLTHVTNALSHVSEITSHDASGRPLTLLDANGATATLTYDVRGRLLSQDVAGNLTQYSYDLTGNVDTISLANGEVITYHYDSAHRAIGYSDALDNKVTYTLDAAGNQLTVEITDSSQTLKQTHQYIYDELSRLRSDIGADSQTATFDYDVNNNLTDQVDPSTNPTNFAFDALDRLIDTTDADLGHTTYSYDDRDNLASVTDANGNVTTYSYNTFDDLIAQNSPDTGVTTYSYDDAGNRLTQTDARGVTTSYSYDALNRLLTVSYPDSSLNISYVYDENANSQNGIGRLTSQIDATGSTTYAYDVRGNVLSMTSTLAGNSFTTAYSYNNADQLTQIMYPNGQSIDYQYDLAGRLSLVDTTDSQSNTQSLLTAISYQPFGPLKDQTYGNGLTMAQVSDLDYRQTSLTTASILERGYGFDANSNITSITDNITADNQTFVYDNLNRLDNADDSSVLYGDIDYQYDGVHNRTAKNTLINSLTDNQSYQYDIDSNILASKTAGITIDYQYDANGNMTDNGTYQFSYGDNNRIETVSQSGSVIATYAYNAQGQRTQKTTATDTTYYLYGLQGELLAEINAAGSLTKSYLFANGQLLAMLEASNVYFVHNDHLGTPQTITDAAQSIVWQATYTPFGEATILTQTVENNIRFPGQYYDAETELHYNYFRFYDPSLGRYITSDPIGLAGGINTFGYVYQNPINYYDPDGQFGLVGAGIGAGIDLGIQLLSNGGNLDCVNWGQVGAAGALGAVGGGIVSGAFKHSKSGLSWFKSSKKWGAVSQRTRRAQNTPRGNELHHWGISRNGSIGKHVPNSIKNHPANLNSIPKGVHQRIHGNHPTLSQYNPVQRWWHGTPGWAKAGQGSIVGGGAAQAASSGDCGCNP